MKTSTTASPLRRRAIAWACALAATLALGAPAVHAQGAPIKIGMVLAKQGPFAEFGATPAAGIEIALQQAGGKLLGRPVELIWYDEANPQTAQQNFSKLVEEDKVSAIIGGTGSGTALAMGSVAKRFKMPFIVSGAGAREITGKECNRYMFRILATVPTMAAGFTPAVLEAGKDWYFVTANYAFGQDVYNSTRAELLKAGGREVGSDVIPGGTTDFSSFILKIRKAQPKVVVVGLGGSDSTTFMKQFLEYGMANSVQLVIPNISDTHVWPLDNTKAPGVHGKLWLYSDPGNSDEEKSFIRAYIAKVGKPPSGEAWQGWVSMRILMAAIEQAKSTDGKAIVQALETVKAANGQSPLYFRSWDHQLMHSILLVRGKTAPANDRWEVLEMVRRVPSNAADIDKMFGSQADVGCSLGDF